MDESKHEIHSQVDAITAGTASMVNLTAGRNTKTASFILYSSDLINLETFRRVEVQLESDPLPRYAGG